jgi:putative hydrolase of the HAD superfamily
MNLITHIFFDLDHTLWDYETNATETLKELYEEYDLGNYFSSENAFIKTFKHVNHGLWEQYNHGQIDRMYIRNERFRLIFKGRVEISQEKSRELSEYFITHCPRKTALMPGAIETLELLRDRFQLGIITNGFDDIQAVKLNSSGMEVFFPVVITSETFGHRKPSVEIFRRAENTAGSKAETSMMIGDNLNTDVMGAKNAGWTSVWFNVGPRLKHEAHFEINQLKELLTLV